MRETAHLKQDRPRQSICRKIYANGAVGGTRSRQEKQQILIQTRYPTKDFGVQTLLCSSNALACSVWFSYSVPPFIQSQCLSKYGRKGRMVNGVCTLFNGYLILRKDYYLFFIHIMGREAWNRLRRETSPSVEADLEVLIISTYTAVKDPIWTQNCRTYW
jgi:hypothetical protein